MDVERDSSSRQRQPSSSGDGQTDAVKSMKEIIGTGLFIMCELSCSQAMQHLASSPGHSHVFNITRTLKMWKCPGDEARYSICHDSYNSLVSTL
jgi:hypothetical protein